MPFKHTKRTEKRKEKRKENGSENLLGSIRPFRFNSVADSLGSPRLTSKTKGVSPAVSEGIEPGKVRFVSDRQPDAATTTAIYSP